MLLGVQTTDSPTAARRVPRHLIDLENPRPRRRDPMSLGEVQKWVLSVLATTTILHFSGGLVLGAMYVDDSALDARIGLNVLAGVVGVIAVLTGRVIHRANPFTPWLLAGLLPTAAGFWLTFG